MADAKTHPAWQRLIQRAGTVPEPDLRRFTSLYHDGEALDEVAGLIDHIDDSNYSPRDWIIALAAFDRWLEDNEVSVRPISSMAGYLHCCTLTSAETLANPPLDRLLLRMLEEYGFDAAA